MTAMTARQKIAKTILHMAGGSALTGEIAERADVERSLAAVTLNGLKKRGLVTQVKYGGRTSPAQWAAADIDGLRQIVDGTLPRAPRCDIGKSRLEAPTRHEADGDDERDSWSLDGKCDLVIEADELSIAIPRERIHALVAFLDRTKAAWDRLP